ncbi:MAG TPA: ATP-binding protein [Mariprofundaceae bacterium]|nr:ATP-binding protein [Mariprofundaceae bacterium]
MLLLRRIFRSSAYFLAIFLILAIFFVTLVLAESSFYAMTGHAVSTWALVLAALVSALLFAPIAHVLQRGLDRLVYGRHLDTMAAIRHLGAGDLAELPEEDVEQALLARICRVTHRTSAALDERRVDDGDVYCFPAETPTPGMMTHPPLRLSEESSFELCLEVPRQRGTSYLYLGPSTDGIPADADEVEVLKSLAQFAAMSLEHARLSRQQADRARLDSISRVAGQLHSHDLKNRLNDLTFLAHNIGTGRLEGEETGRLVEAIRKVVGRMQTLIQRMHDPRAPIHPKFAPMDLPSQLQRWIDQRLWPEQVNVTTDIPTDLPVIRGDAEMLCSVLETLFDNAVQAMQGHGELTIQAHRASDDVEIRIRDSGCGMSRTFIDRKLFRMFTTSKENGLGIGLYLSKRIIEAHGGDIAASSPGQGKGCTFLIRLPLWQSGRAVQEGER